MISIRPVPTGPAHIGYVPGRRGCTVRIFNSEEHLIKNNNDGEVVDEIIKSELREFMPDLVGLSVVTPGMTQSARIAKFLGSYV